MATVSDNFNRSDGNLDGSTASGGGLWVEFENTGWSVESSAAKGLVTGAYNDQSARLDVALDGDDHEVEATYTFDNQPASSYFNIGILARKEDNATKTFYAFTYKTVSNITDLVKFVAGSYTSLGNGADISLNDVLRLTCDGDQIEGLINDVANVSAVTDSSIAGAGYIQVGLHLDHGNIGGACRLDDFSGTDLTPTGPPPKRVIQTGRQVLAPRSAL